MVWLATVATGLWSAVKHRLQATVLCGDWIYNYCQLAIVATGLWSTFEHRL